MRLNKRLFFSVDMPLEEQTNCKIGNIVALNLRNNKYEVSKVVVSGKSEKRRVHIYKDEKLIGTGAIWRHHMSVLDPLHKWEYSKDCFGYISSLKLTE